LLAQELRQKGIARELVAETLAEADLDEDKAARVAAQSRLNSLRGLDQRVAQRRLSGFLARRGFSGETIRRVVSDVLGDLDESAGAGGFDGEGSAE
jgi:regulatory protein